MADGYWTQVERCLLDRCPSILSEWLPGGRIFGHTYSCSNLAGGHGDSLKVNFQKGLWKDWATGVGGGNLTSLYAAIRSIGYRDALHELADKLGVEKKSAKATRAEDWRPISPVPYDMVATDAEGNIIIPEFIRENVTAFWPVWNAPGELLMIQVRQERDGHKTVLPLCYCRHAVTGEHQWRLRGLPRPYPLYGLVELSCSPSKIIIVEGCKTAEAARRLLPDWCPVTWIGGANAANHADWSAVLELPHETEIVIWPDNDTPGQTAATRIAEILDRPLRIVSPALEWPKGYDLADLESNGWDTARAEGYITGHSFPATPRAAATRVEVELSRGDWEKIRGTAEALRDCGTELYDTDTGLGHVRRTIYGPICLDSMTPDGLIALAAKYVTFYFQNGNSRKPTVVTEALAKAVIFHAREFFPPLSRISEMPAVAPDGSILDRNGYHRDMQLYVQVPDGYQARMELDQAVDLLDDLLADFPFETPADKTAAVAYPLTAMLRGAITGPTPLFRFEAPIPGTGKTLLCRVLSELIYPHSAFVTLTDNQEESRKLFTTILAEARPCAVFDNLSRYESPQLASVLTATFWGDRLLGENRAARLPVYTVWAATLNNPTMSYEMLRRTVRIRLNAEMEDPSTRKSFRHRDVVAYVRAERPKFLSALAALCRTVNGSVSAVLPSLGTYESWAERVGAVLESSGYPDFLATAKEDLESAQDEAVFGLQSLVQEWARKFGSSPVTVKELAALASEVPSLPCKKREDGTYSPDSIGRMLAKRRGVIVSGYAIHRSPDTHSRSYIISGHGLTAVQRPEEESLF